MNKKKIYYPISAVAFILMFVSGYFMCAIPDEIKEKYTIRIEGTVTNKFHSNQRYGVNFYLEYGYAYNGKNYQGKGWVSDKVFKHYKQGDKIALQLKSNNPADSMPVEGKIQSVAWIFLFCGMIIAFCAWVGFLVMAIYEKK